MMRLTALLPLGMALVLALAPQASAQVGPNIDELARELANPGAANATLNFKLEYRTFEGTIPGGDQQDSTTLTFQPVFPFVLQNGNNLIFRPAIPYVIGQPSFDPTAGGFTTTSAFGDIPFDLLYSWTTSGFTFGAGVVGAVPTGSGLSSDNWLLGPSLLAVRPTDWGILGLFPFHNEKIGGSGPDTSITSLQYFLFLSLGNGWQIGTGPTMTYDWNAASGQNWTVPLQLAVAKTTAFGGKLVKLNASVDKNIVAPDAFSEDMTFTFTVSPVVKNPFQKTPPTGSVNKATRQAVLAPIR